VYFENLAASASSDLPIQNTKLYEKSAALSRTELENCLWS